MEPKFHLDVDSYLQSGYNTEENLNATKCTAANFRQIYFAIITVTASQCSLLGLAKIAWHRNGFAYVLKQWYDISGKVDGNKLMYKANHLAALLGTTTIITFYKT